MLGGGRNDRLMIISPSGFDESLEEYADDHNVLLVGMGQVLGRSPMPEMK